MAAPRIESPIQPLACYLNLRHSPPFLFSQFAPSTSSKGFSSYVFTVLYRRKVPRRTLNANITNSSDYTFLSGTANVYVDRSFISRTEIPGVNPKEVFKVVLGVDPKISVTYHPREKSVAESGFYKKSLRRTFTQRISIHNTKSIAIEGLRIMDQIPVSEDATNLNVTLLVPALSLPVPVPALGGTGSANTTTNTKVNTPNVNVADGVVAMWNGANEVGKDITALGKDGKMEWVCAIPAFGRINLVSKWEVLAGVKEEIYGL